MRVRALGMGVRQVLVRRGAGRPYLGRLAVPPALPRLSGTVLRQWYVRVHVHRTPCLAPFVLNTQGVLECVSMRIIIVACPQMCLVFTFVFFHHALDL